MSRTPRLFLFAASILVLLTAACGSEQGATPTGFVVTPFPTGEELSGTPLGLTEPVGTAETTITETPVIAETAIGGLETATGVVPGTAGTLTNATQPSTVDTTQTPLIPVTGPDIMLVECQFCVDTRAHALLVLPDTASFQIVSPAPSTTTSTTADTEAQCTTVEVNNGRQVVLCSGPEMTPLTVNICTDASTCTDFPIDLLACPLSQGGAVGPTQTPGAGGTDTSSTTTPSLSIDTATPPGTATSVP